MTVMSAAVVAAPNLPTLSYGPDQTLRTCMHLLQVGSLHTQALLDIAAVRLTARL